MSFFTKLMQLICVVTTSSQHPYFRRCASASRSNALLSAATSILLSSLTTVAPAGFASDHLDSPATVANPAADIADVYAWMTPDGRKLNLVMTILGQAFSDKLEYVLHVDSGKTFGATSASMTIVCRFDSAREGRCTLGNIDSVSGDLTVASGVEGRNGRFRVYAGLRDDPFYNNVKGLLAAYEAANTAISNGAPIDAAGCGQFDETTSSAIQEKMTHTEGGPAQNLLYNWSVSAIVATVDSGAFPKDSRLLAVWGTTSLSGKRLDRMGRPFVANTLLGVTPFSTDDASGIRRQAFNVADRATSDRFIAELQKSLAFQDSLDGRCGNQVFANSRPSPVRYRTLAKLIADDRLWVNRTSTTCTQFFAVELAQLAGSKTLESDCGGRSPVYDTSNVWRSLMIAGSTSGISDGLHEDEHSPSATLFPFLAPPDPHAVNH